MGHMPGGNMRTGRYTVCLLIVKKDVRLIGFEEFRFIQSTEENGFINTNVPCAQRSDDTLVSGSRSGSHECSSDGRLGRGKRLLQMVQG